MKKKIVSALLMLSIAGLVQAEQLESPWSGDTDLGFIKQSGNTSAETINFRQLVVYDAKPWVNTIKLEASRSESDGHRSGEKYYVLDKVDYYIGDLSYAFARGTWEKDLYSGFEHQATLVVGYGRTLIEDDRTKLQLEVGIGQSVDEVDEKNPVNHPDLDGSTDRSGLIYFSEQFAWKISRTSELGQELSVEDTDINTISRFNVFVKSALAGDLSLKVSYDLKYSDEVPPEQKHKDEKFTVALSYSF